MAFWGEIKLGPHESGIINELSADYFGIWQEDLENEISYFRDQKIR